MATSRIGSDFFVDPASADLSANQFFVVVRDGNGEIAVAGDGLGDGILVDEPAAQGESATVQYRGEGKGVAGAAFGINVKLTSNASGKLVLATSGKHVIARSKQLAAAVDEIVELRFQFEGILV